MKLADVIDNLTKLLASVDKKSFVYDFLAAFGTPKATLARLKSGNLNVAKKAGCILLKGKVYFEPVIKELIKTPSPREIVELATANPQIERNKPRFLFSTDFKEFVAYDTKRKEWLEVAFKELGSHYTFFLPLAGMEKTSFQEETDADVRAADQMAKLYDLIIADNPPSSKTERHQLNVFLTRLLFCLFAEDTGIFSSQLFTNSINSFSQSDGSDVGQLIQDIFLVLSTEPNSRKKIKPHLAEFPYVNGGLFNDTASKRPVVPKFTSKSRLKLIDLGGKSWKEINPDIFGSMFQGVVDAEVRADLGMHYTSVPNIMKVIKPLFIDDLYEDFEKGRGSESKLNSLLKRIYSMQIFDPACGSGNFLIIAYKELRRLEMAIFKELQTLTTKLPLSGIHLSRFYGIEIDDFAYEVAILAMWLAEHQMNVEFKVEFGEAPAALPLKDKANIFHRDATNCDWNDLLSNSKKDLYIIGNPPYCGARKQSEAQKDSVKRCFSEKPEHKDADYICCWFLKGASLVAQLNAKLAFVTTNSLCQGDHIGILWPHILGEGVEIYFAYPSFKWKNNAKDAAAVTCSIVGIRNSSKEQKWIYKDEFRSCAKNISPYLIDSPNIIISKRKDPISAREKAVMGSMARDGGFLIIERAEKELLEQAYPSVKKIIRSLTGADEFFNNKPRWCLWIENEDLEFAKSIPPILKKIQQVKSFRLTSSAKTTNQYASIPHQFAQRAHKKGISFIIPSVCPEKRVYLPIGVLNEKTVITNLALVIYNADLWLFSLISSRLHMVWIKAVAGRLGGEGIRYSTTICYNCFPFPKLTTNQIRVLKECAEQILITRERFPSKRIADLYDPDTMPKELLDAHHYLDGQVESCYRKRPFSSDEERLQFLLALFEKETSATPVSDQSLLF